MCLMCPVRRQCDEYRAETDTRYGVWAGKLHNDQEEK